MGAAAAVPTGGEGTDAPIPYQYSRRAFRAAVAPDPCAVSSTARPSGRHLGRSDGALAIGAIGEGFLMPTAGGLAAVECKCRNRIDVVLRARKVGLGLVLESTNAKRSMGHPERKYEMM